LRCTSLLLRLAKFWAEIRSGCHTCGRPVPGREAFSRRLSETVRPIRRGRAKGRLRDDWSQQPGPVDDIWSGSRNGSRPAPTRPERTP
jgi:hypothetical protein